VTREVNARFVRRQAAPSKATDSNLENGRTNFRFVIALSPIAVRGRPRPLASAGQEESVRESATEASAEGGGARKGLKFGNWLGDWAGTIAAIALLWSLRDVVVPGVRRHASWRWRSAPWCFVGQQLRCSRQNRPAAQPEWPAGAAGGWLSPVIDPPLRRHPVVDHQGAGHARCCLEMGPRGASGMAPSAFNGSRNAAGS